MRTIAALMAFGSGVLISALSFELMDEACRASGFWACAADALARLTPTALKDCWAANVGLPTGKR